jgi:hypothetical protein
MYRFKHTIFNATLAIFSWASITDDLGNYVKPPKTAVLIVKGRYHEAILNIIERSSMSKNRRTMFSIFPANY